MSPIGRIFLVLNLILSAAFLGWASNSLAQTDDYKLQLADAEKAAGEAAEALDAEIADLNIQLTSKTTEASENREQRDASRTEVDRLTADLAAEKAEKDRLLADVTTIQGTLDDFNETIGRISSEKDQANQRREEAEAARDDAIAAQATAEQGQRDAEGVQQDLERNIADLEMEKTSLGDQVSTLETHLAVLSDHTGVSIGEIMSLPQVDGAVLAVDASVGLVMLNVGSANDVKRGFVFDVWAGNIYKGQVKVQNVQEGMCSATIENPVAGTSIQQGDLASTRML